jgi:hypothetical protein
VPTLRLLPLLTPFALACGAAGTVPTPATAPVPATTATPAGLPARDEATIRNAGLDPALLRCNTLQTWSKTLRAEAKGTAREILDVVKAQNVTLPADADTAAHKAVTEIVAWRMVRTTLLDGNQNNLGAVPLAGLTGVDGKPLVLFRSSYTPAPKSAHSCYRSLVDGMGVRHVVNLYTGPMPVSDLDAMEREVVAALGGSYFVARDSGDARANWREGLREGADPAKADEAAFAAVAALIREVLRPGGAAPKGHVLVHCGGGMHRTGMVVGVIERCLNGTEQATWEAAYRRHVAFRSEAEPGGFEAANVAFIARFPCDIVKDLKPAAR